MLITIAANIKSLIDKTGSEDDVILQAIALGVSARVESYLGRAIESTERTAYIDVDKGQKLFPLKAFPVSAVTGVWNDFDRSWSTEIDSDLYTFLGDWGELIIDQYILVAGAKRLKVTYTGGLAATQSALQTSYPDIEMAARIQGAFVYEKRQKLGLGAEAVAGSSVRFQVKYKLLPDVMDTLDQYRREYNA